jgi:hypothetical protein
MTDTNLRPRLTFVAAIGAPIIAILMYFVGALLAGFLIGLPLALFHPVPVVVFAQGIVAGGIGMWVARRATDVVFKRYSGRGVFVVFLVLALMLAMAGFVAQEHTPHLLFNELQMLAVVGFAYWQFWRRDQVIEAAPANAFDDGERRGIHRIWEPLAPLIGAAPMVLFIVMGLVQLWAVSDEIHAVTHLPGFLSMGASLFLTYVPLIGSVIGFFGAKDVWGWEWWQAALLCFGPFGLVVVFGLLGATFDAARRRFA